MNADELFSALEVRSLSPKIRWLQDNGIETEYVFKQSDENDPDLEVPYWVCRKREPASGTVVFLEHEIAIGKTEEEAIAEYAIKNGLRLWFECDVKGGVSE